MGGYCGRIFSTKRPIIEEKRNGPKNVGSRRPWLSHRPVGHKATKQAKADKHADDPNEPAIRDSIILPGDMHIHPPQTCPSPISSRRISGTRHMAANVPVITFTGSRTVPSAVIRESTLLIWLFASVISIEICAR